MSIKTELQSNNTDLQSLIDVVNSLPEKENIDAEMTTQDDLIAQITAALEGKMVPSSEPEVISITVKSNSPAPVFYCDASGAMKEATKGTTFEALNGIVFYFGTYILCAIGDYTTSSIGQYQSVKFNSTGGTVYVIPNNGSGD